MYVACWKNTNNILALEVAALLWSFEHIRRHIHLIHCRHIDWFTSLPDAGQYVKDVAAHLSSSQH